MNGDGTVFMFDEVLHGLQLTFEGFQNMCVAAGCDYLKNIHGVGIKRSCMLAKEHQADFAETLSRNKRAPDNYLEDFKSALQVFNHQTVFDIDTCETVPLKQCLNGLSFANQHLCGEYPLVLVVYYNM